MEADQEQIGPTNYASEHSHGVLRSQRRLPPSLMPDGSKTEWLINRLGRNRLTVNKECIAQKEFGFSYSVFGLHLRSNCPLPGVSPRDFSTDNFDVALHVGFSPDLARTNPLPAEELLYTSPETNAAGVPSSQISKVENGELLRLAYEDGTQFWIDRNRENIWATWPEGLSLENAATYLFGPVLGILLRLRGVTCLHASAVSIGNRSVAFVGAAGAGKSTTAAALALEAYGIISDDIVALSEREGTFFVLPAYPYLCLWPESVNMLYGSAEALPRFLADWDKRRLDLGGSGTRFESRALPLGAIYVLGDRRPDPAPYVEGVRPKAGLLSLVADSFANKILDREMRAREFAVLGRLVTTVPIRRIHPHKDPSRLEELCAVIHKDFASLHNATSARL
jgi:hypothetical protein